MTTTERARILDVLAVAILILAASSARLYAQTRVRVTRDQAVVWLPNFSSAATVVKMGTVLEVVRKQGDWYEVTVRVPGSEGPSTGMIAVNQVEPVGNEAIGSEPSGNPRPPAARPPSSAAGAVAAPGASQEPVWGLRVFGDAAYERFAASDAFTAVFDQSGGPWFGGGGEYRYKRLFLQASLERFHKTGQRVFVSNSEVSKLGIPDTVTMTRFGVTAGYRFPHGMMIPYLGAGAGSYSYDEESTFADPSENVSRRVVSYHALGGVEWRLSRWFGTAVEVQYTRVPDGLTGGAADAFDEHDLGGVLARVKVLFGK